MFYKWSIGKPPKTKTLYLSGAVGLSEERENGKTTRMGGMEGWSGRVKGRGRGFEDSIVGGQIIRHFNPAKSKD